MPDQIDIKTGLTIKEVLQSKHSSATTPHPSTLHPYDECRIDINPSQINTKS
jgi:hypothetical protein